MLDIEMRGAIRQQCHVHTTRNPESAKRFFKTSPESYGAGDAFLGITVPHVRKIAKMYSQIGLDVIQDLLYSEYNEERLLALFILVDQYKKANIEKQAVVCQFYLKNIQCVNNWNLVDSSAHLILGHYLLHKDKSLLKELALSPRLWDRRIAILATWAFIRNEDTKTTFELAKILIKDPHDLIHKAVGWMLREAGKKQKEKLIAFLSEYGVHMPRTMFRYAIEKIPKNRLIDM